MADPESILQLGIEAARDGNKEEARNLFRLLTREDPQNAQAWLWLAGVAENREERTAALQQTLNLDPDNEMAIKGLQALGVKPEPRPAGVAPPEPVPPAPAPTMAPAERDDPFADEEDPFAELDALSDAIANEPTAVRREGVDEDAIAAAAAAGAAAGAAAANRPAAPAFDSDPDQPSGGRGSRERPQPAWDDDEETTVPARRGVSPLLLGIAGLAAVVLLIIFLWQLFFSGPSQIVTVPTVVPGDGIAATSPAQNQAGQAGTPGAAETPGGTAEGGVAGAATAAPGETAPAGEATPAAAASPEPGATAPPATGAQGQVPPPEEANPAIVPANTPLESNGWLYDFNQPTYATSVVGELGQFQPQGRFAVVLVFVANRTGQAQALPDDFFVLKDAQGRVYTPRPEVSPAYVIPGVNADLSQQQEIPADGLTRSVALVFDVAPDATNLVFFARSNPSQGWQVLPRV